MLCWSNTVWADPLQQKCLCSYKSLEVEESTFVHSVGGWGRKVEEKEEITVGLGIPGKNWSGQLVQREVEERVERKPGCNMQRQHWCFCHECHNKVGDWGTKKTIRSKQYCFVPLHCSSSLSGVTGRDMLQWSLLTALKIMTANILHFQAPTSLFSRVITFDFLTINTLLFFPFQ